MIAMYRLSDSNSNLSLKRSSHEKVELEEIIA